VPPLRRTALFDEHVALGADMGAYTWAGMALPWSYHTPLAEEQRAVHERAGLADVSQLQLVSVRGPRAAAVLEQLVPRRIADLHVGSSRFSVVLSRFGRICDEGLVMRFADDEFWISHGCGATRAQLAKVVEAMSAADVRITPLDDTHVLSVQGPSSLAVLAPLASVDLGALPFLGHQRVRLGDRPVVVSRSGFTGELGFEIFCAATDAVPLWRLLLGSGAPLGLTPYGYACIDLLRLEAGFPLYPVDFAMLPSLWEAGLGWLVRDKVLDYVGRTAVEQAKGTATHRLAGVRISGPADLPRGVGLQRGEHMIGVVTSSAFSPASGETLCLARVETDALTSDAPVAVPGAPRAAGQLLALPFQRAPRRLAASVSP
jgi:aminomethyltransferase